MPNPIAARLWHFLFSVSDKQALFSQKQEMPFRFHRNGILAKESGGLASLISIARDGYQFL